MIFYVTKYALTKGIQKVEGEYTDNSKSMIAVNRGYVSYFHGLNKDFCLTAEMAAEVANNMKASKIISLEKSVKKMKAKQFDVAEIKNAPVKFK